MPVKSSSQMQGLRRRWNCRLAGACGFQTATASFAAAAQTEAGWNAPSLSQVQWPNSHVMLDWSLGAVLVLLSLLVGVCLYLNRRLGKAVRARTTALTEYESRYREFAETAAHWLWEMDPELRFTWVSDSFKSATGLSPSDVIGHTRWDAAGVAEITGNWFEHREILSRRLAFEDFRYGYRDGLNSIRFVEISGKPIFDACNTFLGYRGTGRDVSERVRADASLTEREAELRGFYESAPLMMGVVEIHEDDLRHVSCNRSSATFLGATPEDLRGRPTAEVGLPRQVRKEWLRHTRQAERTEVPVSFEYDHPTNDGPRRVWGVMRRIDDGDRRLALYVLNDVTEQRRTEATLRRTAQILSEVSANMPGMVFQLRRDGNGHDRFEFVSQSAESLVGHSNERLLTDACLLKDSVLPDDLGHFLASLIHSAAWVVPWSCEFRILRRQDPRWIRVSATSARAEDGAIVWDGVMVDITELREREDRIRGIMEATIDAIVTIDEIGVIETVNRSTQTMFGYAAEQLLGRNINILMPPDYARQHGDYLQRYLKTGEARIIGFGREVEGQRKDGSRFPVDLVVDELTPQQGRRRFIGTLRDLTEYKATEAQLRQAQKMEAIGQLTGGIAHDFNNLLAVILGNLEFLEDHVDPSAEAGRFLDGAIRATNRGAELTQHLLAFSRRQSLRPTATNVPELVTGLAELLRRTLGETVDVHTELNSDAWPALVDSGQLESAILNLALNARDAMAEGGQVTVSVTNRVASDPGEDSAAESEDACYVEVAVRDTGCGIAPTHRDRVFDPFFTTKGVGKGSGLGLSMVYGFVKQSKGHICLDSAVGEGTTVRMLLPRAPAPDPTVDTTGDTVEQTGRGESILLVEDESQVRALTGAMLRDLGYRVLQAADGPEGLSILGKHPEADLLLTDVALPRHMNGVALAQRARSLRPHLRVLFCTACTDQNLMDGMRQEPESRLITKPFRRHALAAAVRELLDRQAPRRPGGSSVRGCGPRRLVEPQNLPHVVETGGLAPGPQCGPDGAGGI